MLSVNVHVIVVDVPLQFQVLIQDLFNYILNSLSINGSNGYILLAIAYGFKGLILMAKKPLHVFINVSVFLTHTNGYEMM